jgi:phosphopantothenoylcysteine decarboxylase/phosphopantothenate--cysteine ligase
MWAAAPTQENVSKLRQWGYHFVGPAEGNLACGTTGTGRMVESAELLAAIVGLLKNQPPRKAQ